MVGLGAGEAKPEVAPGIVLVVAAGDRGSHDPQKASDLRSQQSFQRPDGPLTGDDTKVDHN